MRGQRFVDRFKQRQQALQAVGQRAQRQVQTVRLPVGQQPVGGPVEQILVQQQGDPDRHAQVALEEDARGRRGADEAGMHAAVTGRAITAAADDAAIGRDRDLQNGGILGTADGGEGPAAAVAVAVRAQDFVFFDDGGQVAVVAAPRPWFPRLLAAWPPRWSGRGRGRGCVRRWGSSSRGLGFAAEELLLAETQLGAELFDLLS